MTKNLPETSFPSFATAVGCAVAVVLCLALASCGNKRNKSEDEAPAPPPEESIQRNYRVANQDCDTQNRVYFKKSEYCANLQIPMNNNNCPLEVTKGLFVTSCQGYTWNPEQTLAQLYSAPGIKTKCFHTEGSPSLSDVRNDPKINYEIQHFSNAPTFSTLHENSQMIVEQSFGRGLAEITIKIVNPKTQSVIKQVNQAWNIAKYPPTQVELKTEQGYQVTCYPKVTE